MSDIQYQWVLGNFKIAYNTGSMSNVVTTIGVQLLGTYTAENRVINCITNPIYQNFHMPSPSGFIPYNELTQDTVRTWVETALSPITNRLKLEVSASIAEELNPSAQRTEGYALAPWENPNVSSNDINVGILPYKVRIIQPNNNT